MEDDQYLGYLSNHYYFWLLDKFVTGLKRSKHVNSKKEKKKNLYYFRELTVQVSDLRRYWNSNTDYIVSPELCSVHNQWCDQVFGINFGGAKVIVNLKQTFFPEGGNRIAMISCVLVFRVHFNEINSIPMTFTETPFSYFQSGPASLPRIKVSLCFKVGAFLEELEYIFRASRPGTLGGFRGACTSAYICTHNYRTASQKWRTSAPWRGELGNVIVIINIAYAAAIVALLRSAQGSWLEISARLQSRY